ncbi:hypothetical protein [Herbidospora cretacea]|uniref:hypothetical protein n=1 Tax=Herbidospora cretacea TaxID=28444 RepID=UPI000772FC06|nr:hypothetical protein [Herbidospora cretacea]
MSAELAQLAQEVSPYVTAAISAYGAAVLARANDDAADATVGWGRGLLRRIFGTAPEETPEAVAELAADPDDPDLQAALRVQIRRLLSTDPELAADVRAMLDQARAQGPAVTASGDRSVAVGGDNTGVIATGDDAFIAGR